MPASAMSASTGGYQSDHCELGLLNAPNARAARITARNPGPPEAGLSQARRNPPAGDGCEHGESEIQGEKPHARRSGRGAERNPIGHHEGEDCAELEEHGRDDPTREDSENPAQHVGAISLEPW